MEEIWKKHPNIHENYEFSNLGRFRNCITNKILKPTVNTQPNKKNGYVITFLLTKDGKTRKRIRIHRIIAELFVENPDEENFKVINHIDGNKLNNKADNLEWTNHYHNIRHAIDNNLRKHSPIQKISLEDVVKIREEYDKTSINISKLAKKYDITSDNISCILKYATFKDIDPDKKMSYKINKLPKKELIEWQKQKTVLRNKGVLYMP
jgi:hypothetical protein